MRYNQGVYFYERAMCLSGLGAATKDVLEYLNKAISSFRALYATYPTEWDVLCNLIIALSRLSTLTFLTAEKRKILEEARELYEKTLKVANHPRGEAIENELDKQFLNLREEEDIELQLLLIEQEERQQQQPRDVWVPLDTHYAKCSAKRAACILF